MKYLSSLTLGILTSIGGFLDAGTIATSAAAGSRFGLGLVWPVLLGTLAVVLLVEMSGRLTAISGHTYAAAVRERFGFKFFLLPLTTELIAETVLLTAEIGGAAIACSLLTGLSWRLWFPIVALVVWLMVWRAPFGLIENGPALLGLLSLAFVAGVVALGGPAADQWRTLALPKIQAGAGVEYLFLVAAIFGATISPYLVYFYSSGAAQEGWGRDSLGTNKLTAIVGMGFGSVTSIALLVLAALVLQPRGIGSGTLGELGLALADPFGPIGAVVFAVALFATCFGAALEVLLSLGYLLAQGMGWAWGSEPAAKVPRFKLALLLILLVAVAVGLVGVDPLRLAMYASALIALVLPFSLLPFLAIMNDPAYLKECVNRRAANIATLLVIVLAALVAVVSIPLLVLSGGG